MTDTDGTTPVAVDVLANDSPPAGAHLVPGSVTVVTGPQHGSAVVAPATGEITYTAMGRGIYALQTPPAKILDRFQIQLTANGSDVRMLELSMQPMMVYNAQY